MSTTRAFTRKPKPEAQANENRPQRIVLVDDEQKHLEGFENALAAINLQAEQTIVEGRGYLMLTTNGLLHQLKAWQAHGWQPDLILIDKTVASAQGTGLDYVRELQGAEDHSDFALVGVPVVIHTKAVPNEADSNSFAHGRADGYSWARDDSVPYFQGCLQSLPLWRAQARRRVWQTLLDLTASGLAKAQSLELAVQFLAKISFEFMTAHLGCQHGFVRRRSTGQHFPLIATFNPKNWAVEDRTDRLEDLPLVKEVLEMGSAQRPSINREDAGRYTSLVGKAMIGAVLPEFGDQPFGCITLVRDTPFDTDDLRYLQRFGELLGSVYGRQRYLERRRAEMEAARDFAAQAARAASESDVCSALANLTHQLLNDGSSTEGKATVRLVPMGTAELMRMACAGYCDLNAPSILLSKRDSIYANTVRDACTNFYETEQALKQAGYFHTGRLVAGTELCVPLTVVGPEGNLVAFGAVNAEHADEYAYGESNRRVLEVLAQVAASAVQRLRQQSALEELAKLATATLEQPADEQWVALNKALAQYAAHGALLHMVPPTGVDSPAWLVRHVWRAGVDSDLGNDVLDDWQRHFDRLWDRTFTAKAIAQFEAGTAADALYSTDFASTENLLDGTDDAVTANAAVPLWSQGRLSGVWLFLWYGRPALDRDGLKVLQQFASYAQGLLDFQSKWNDLEQLRLRAEQQAELAMTAQMYEHVLQHDLGGLSHATESLLRAASLNDAKQVALDLKNRLSHFSERSSLTVRSMSVPRRQTVKLDEVWQKACAMLNERASSLCVSLERPDALSNWQVSTDPDILQLTIFILIQNALDAFAESGQSGRVWLEVTVCDVHAQCRSFRIYDDGPGIPASLLPSLCQAAVRGTKPRSQGVALYVQAHRLRQHLNGNLLPSNPQPRIGSSFDLTLPVVSQ